MPVEDFEPVSLVATMPNVLLASPSPGVDSVDELIELLKRDPSKRTYASSGAAPSTHLTGALFAEVIDVPLSPRPLQAHPAGDS